MDHKLIYTTMEGKKWCIKPQYHSRVRVIETVLSVLAFPLWAPIFTLWLITALLSRGFHRASKSIDGAVENLTLWVSIKLFAKGDRSRMIGPW